MKLFIFGLFATLLTACNLLSPTNLVEITEVPTTKPLATPTAIVLVPTATQDVVVAPTLTSIPPTAEPVVNCIPREDWLVYTVQPGDTLGRIAQRVDSTVNELATASCLANINIISVGQQLRVPVLPPAEEPVLIPVGDVAGQPGFNACWASNPGTNPLVYDSPDINAEPFGYLVNRVYVVSSDSVGWLTVSHSARADVSYMRSDTVNLLGNCDSVLGIPADQYWHYYGSHAGIPSNVCAVMPIGQSAFVYRDPVPNAPETEQIGILIGWVYQASIHNAGYYEIAEGPYTGWVRTTEVVESDACNQTPLPSFGNNGAIPSNLCAVSPIAGGVVIFDQAGLGGPYDALPVGFLTGWMRVGAVHNAGFYEITDDAHAIGWVESSQVTQSAGCNPNSDLPVHFDPGSPPTTVCNAVHPGGTAQITIRQGAGEQFAPIAMLGNWAEIINTQGDWLQVLLGPGSTGWINGDIPNNSPNLVGAC